MFTFCITIHGTGSNGALAVSFDMVFDQLAALPRMFIELDGSFVWRGVSAEGREWQVDGNLIDRGDVLAYVELKGTCPVERFEQILTALGWPGERLLFGLPRLGITIDEAEFRRRTG